MVDIQHAAPRVEGEKDGTSVNIHRLSVVFFWCSCLLPFSHGTNGLIRCELRRSANLWSQVFDSIKWQTVLVCKVKGKPLNFTYVHTKETCLCG